jgi:nucleoside-diphosphate-sugar epimerase
MTEPLRILVLGGTAWLGGTVASLAVARGHDVTCLARGESGPVPDGAKHVRADRWAPGAYDEVAASEWDAVIDVSWQPEQVRSALSALAPAARRWLYVSSISVYADHGTPGADESAPLLDPWSGSGEAPIEEYGGAKVSCETACTDAVEAERLLLARAGLIVGYGDRSDRFGYWPARFARAAARERVLAPPADAPVQLIDVADLAQWLLHSAESGVAGTFDATGGPLTFGAVAEACASVLGTDAELVAPDDGWLSDQVRPWAGPESLPLWLPRAALGGMVSRPAAAAREARLTTRPLEETVDDSARWEKQLGLDRDRRAGLTPGREAELLRLWLERG